MVGFTRYAVEGDPASGAATIEIVDRGGISLGVPSRVERNSHLQGTKRRVAMERELLVARGRHDGRTVLMVPEAKRLAVHGHHPRARAVRRAAAGAGARAVLQGWDRRYDRLVDWVTETEGGVPGRPAGRDPGGRPPDDPRERPGRALAVSFRFRPPGTAGLRRRRVIGVGLDVVDIERFREVPARRPAMHQRLFTDGERGPGRRPHWTRCRRWRCASARQGGRDEGARRRTRRASFQEVEVVRQASGASELRVTGAAAALAAAQGVTAVAGVAQPPEATAAAVVNALSLRACLPVPTAPRPLPVPSASEVVKQVRDGF